MFLGVTETTVGLQVVEYIFTEMTLIESAKCILEILPSKPKKMYQG